MFIDTHCHLTDEYIINDLENFMARAATANVDTIICPTADPADIESALNIADTHNNVFCTIGIHPEYVNADAKQYLTDAVMTHPRVIGVGEIGLDYHFGDDDRMAQIKLFSDQLAIAKKHNLPVAIHTRDAERDTADILKGDIRGVMHCFTSSWDLAKTMLDRGFYFSASGILTFKNANDIRETFAKIPLDRLVIETDSPWCAPVPHRGEKCEPAFVADTARVLADIKNIPIEELAPMLRENVKKLYPKIVL